jgi:hypothetical protein
VYCCHRRNHLVDTWPASAAATRYLVDLHLRQHVFDDGPTFTPPMPRENSNDLSVWPASGLRLRLPPGSRRRRLGEGDGQSHRGPSREGRRRRGDCPARRVRRRRPNGLFVDRPPGRWCCVGSSWTSQIGSSHVGIRAPSTIHRSRRSLGGGPSRRPRCPVRLRNHPVDLGLGDGEQRRQLALSQVGAQPRPREKVGAGTRVGDVLGTTPPNDRCHRLEALWQRPLLIWSPTQR